MQQLLHCSNHHTYRNCIYYINCKKRTMLTDIDASAYLVFYEKLVSKFIEIEYHGKKKPHSLETKDVWEIIRDDLDEEIPRSSILFSSPLKNMKKDYFWQIRRRVTEGKYKNGFIRIQAEHLILALQYMGYKTSFQNPDSRVQADELLEKFYQTDNRVKNAKRRNIEIVKTGNFTIASPSLNGPLFQSLNNAIYTFEHLQGTRLDKGYIEFRTTGKDQLTGTFFVNYQGEDDSYINPKMPELLSKHEISGYCLYESLLLLTYINRKGGDLNRHAGVMKLEYSSMNRFSGKYLVYYFGEIPPKRRNIKDAIDDLGYMVFDSCKSIDEAITHTLNLDENGNPKEGLTYRDKELY
jgi:hypothetical protein